MSSYAALLSRSFQRGKRGIALIITLFAIVLLTIVILAFFSRSVLNRQISSASSEQIQSELIGQSSLNIVVGELREEIRNGSYAQVISGTTAYIPNQPSGLVPSQSGLTSPTSPAVLKVSGAKMYTGTALNFTSTAASDAPSQNGRYVSTGRWYDPTLGAPGLGSNKLAPKWIFMTRNNGAKGTTTLTLTNARNQNNDDTVIGRFAFNVYDQGGLLDANVAGYPNDPAKTSTGTVAAIAALAPYKSSISYADLAVAALGINQAQLGDWRNAATGVSAETFSEWVTGTSSTGSATPATAAAQSGHVEAAQGDNAFVGRGDLIQAALQGKAGITTTALTSLTHFSRTLPVAGAGPFYDASTLGGGSSDAYKSNATPSTSNPTPTPVNPLLPAIRFSSCNGTALVHYRDDGSQAPATYIPQNGDPYLRQKFSLAKLAWLTWQGPLTGISNAAIQACFGLQWDSTNKQWDYVGASGGATSIETLAQAATENREPNFFELIKAGILVDSLGLSSGNITYTGSRSQDASSDVQALQIGANMIDQADTDSFPTCITIGAAAVYGIENLPYINRLTFRPYRPPDVKPNPTYDTFECWAQFDVWNPHYRAGSVIEDKSQSGGAYPAKFRIMMTDGVMSANPLGAGPQPASVYYLNPQTTSPAAVGSTNPLTAPTVTFPSSDSWSTPQTLLPSLGAVGINGFQALSSQTNPDGSPLALSPDGVALFLGSVYAPDSNYTGQYTTDPYLFAFVANYQVTPTFALQYLNSAGDWRTYEVWNDCGIVYQYGDTGSAFLDEGGYQGFNSNNCWFFGYGPADPRIMRFGIQLRGYSGDPYAPIDSGCLGVGYKGATDAAVLSEKYYLSGSSFSPNSPAQGSSINYFQSAYNDGNGSSANPYYNDKDGVQRYGDGANASGTDVEFYNTSQPGGLNDQPVILDRPFRSVAELGYVARDLPWKTLDFNTGHSADAGLLSLFSVTDEAPVISLTTQTPLVAGKINVNTAPAAVVQSMLSGAALNPEATGTPTLINSTTAGNIAAGVAGSVASSPWASESDGVFQFVSNTSVNSTVNSLTRSLSDGTAASDKKAREAVMRSLGGVEQSRTWVLLVDVIAQTGTYPTTASTFDQFVVKGECRYWLSIAIDRYTGKIVDEQLEIPSNN